MTDKNQTPDRAGSYDADGFDVPTYNKDTHAADPATGAAGSGSTPMRNYSDATTEFPRSGQTSDGIFDRTGRAAPQEIPPAQPAYADQDYAAPTGGTETFAYDRPQSQPVAAAAPVAPAPAPVVTDYDSSTPVEPVHPDHRRGTIDFGLLIIRLLLGVVLILSALATFFRLGGNPGLSGLEAEYADYLAPGILSVIVPSLQLAAGVFLVLGLITPLFAMVATIVTSFTALHELSTSGAGFNVFAWPETVWLSLVLLGISAALQFTGPGLVSLDFGRSWARRPLVSSWLFVLLAIAGGVALWWFGTGVNPFN